MTNGKVEEEAPKHGEHDFMPSTVGVVLVEKMTISEQWSLKQGRTTYLSFTIKVDLWQNTITGGILQRSSLSYCYNKKIFSHLVYLNKLLPLKIFDEWNHC